MLRPVFACLLLLLTAALAAGSVVLHADLDTLTASSKRAIRGRVAAKTTVMDHGSGHIWTRYQVDVLDTLLGEEAERLDVYVPGGKAGKRDQRVHGTARLARGQEVVLFLWEDDGGQLRVVGQCQGAFHVRRSRRAGGKTLCHNGVRGLVLLDSSGRRKQAEPIRMELSDLEERVRRVDDARRIKQEELARIERERVEELRRRAERRSERLRGRPGHEAADPEDD